MSNVSAPVLDILERAARIIAAQPPARVQEALSQHLVAAAPDQLDQLVYVFNRFPQGEALLAALEARDLSVLAFAVGLPFERRLHAPQPLLGARPRR